MIKFCLGKLYQMLHLMSIHKALINYLIFCFNIISIKMFNGRLSIAFCFSHPFISFRGKSNPQKTDENTIVCLLKNLYLS